LRLSWGKATIHPAHRGQMDKVIERKTDKDTKPNRWPIAIFLIFLAVCGIAIVALLRSPPTPMPFRNFSLPSASMEPTLRLGEYLFANMWAFDEQGPARGDIVVFRLPRDRSTIYIKRVVGLPGEKVQIKNGILHIDGQAVPTVDAGTYQVSDGGGSGRLKRETLPNGASVTTLDIVANGFYDNTPVYEVPQGHYFMLGDNRDNSTDSRALSQMGYVPRANIIGRAARIFWSPDLSRIGTRPQ
jgi:signal peptidase I